MLTCFKSVHMHDIFGFFWFCSLSSCDCIPPGAAPAPCQAVGGAHAGACCAISVCSGVFKGRAFLRDSFHTPAWQMPCVLPFPAGAAAQDHLPSLTRADKTLPILCSCISPTEHTNYPYYPFFFYSFDHDGCNILTVTTDPATLELLSHQGKRGFVFAHSLISQRERRSGAWQVAGELHLIPHLLQNGALLLHCLFNEQWISQEWGCVCAGRFSVLLLFILPFSKSKVLPCSHILHVWFEFLGQGCLHFRITEKTRAGTLLLCFWPLGTGYSIAGREKVEAEHSLFCSGELTLLNKDAAGTHRLPSVSFTGYSSSFSTPTKAAASKQLQKLFPVLIPSWMSAVPPSPASQDIQGPQESPQQHHKPSLSMREQGLGQPKGNPRTRSLCENSEWMRDFKGVHPSWFHFLCTISTQWGFS